MAFLWLMTFDSPTVPALARGGRVRLRTLITVRWIAIAGQVAALGIVRYGLGFPLPIGPAVGVVGASAALNLWLSSRRRGSALLSDRMAAVQLGYDMLQLAALLCLTGGLGNPFAVLILAPVTVSATVLSRRSTISLSVLALAILALLARYHLPLPWPDGAFRLEPMFILGLMLALGTAVVFIAAYVSSVSEEARRMSDALSATQMALDRERRASAVGALAAAAAHELGTPLGTIALVAHEIARELPKDSPISGDVALLQSEAKRCRDILAELAARPEIAIHMAAQSLVRHSYVAPVDTYAVNVMGTAHFLEAARSTDTLKAALCVATDKCYENIGLTRGYREDDPAPGHQIQSGDAPRGAADAA